MGDGLEPPAGVRVAEGARGHRRAVEGARGVEHRGAERARDLGERRAARRDHVAQHWQTLLAGSEAAAADYGIEVATFGPTSETDIAGQVQLVENSVSRGADAILMGKNGVDGVYVTFDTDSIDSGFAPGTTGPEPGGFTGEEIIRLGKLVGARGLTAVDNVELCPVYDPSGVTARLVWEVLSQMLYAHARSHMGA